jgi:hypothetical protein
MRLILIKVELPDFTLDQNLSLFLAKIITKDHSFGVA